MKSTTKTTENRRTENDDIKIIGKKFVFVINNDENTELTDIPLVLHFASG